MNLEQVRKELDKYDNIIKTMVVLRMSLIPLVADNKIKNNLPIYQGKREEQIYNNIQKFSEENGVDSNLIKEIYQLIIANAIKIEEQIVYDHSNTILNKEKDLKQIEKIKDKFNELDNILLDKIPSIIEEVKEISKENNLNLTQLSTLYYHKEGDDVKCTK